ncbi:MAG: hypothetical protein ACSHWW_12610 [Nonlabens sp.]|uniref:hypothetical protein n=1 Tax=Nonlabens sp. TaxID=1888209 RepID=UPI003EF876C4
MKRRLFISRLLLAIFVMVQLSTLHELGHEDSSHNCDICIVAHDMQSTALEIQPVLVIETPVVFTFYKQDSYEYYASAKAYSKTSHLSIRPPPAV